MIVTLFAAAALAAAPADAPRVERVSYADLDVASAKGRRVLDRRVASAIEKLCGSYAAVKADDADRTTACRKVARASVAQQLARLDAGDRAVAIAAR